jgi:sugar lactone lactonase YvrE
MRTPAQDSPSTTVPSDRPPRASRPARAWGAISLIVLVAAGALAWWTRAERVSDRTVEPYWRATVVAIAGDGVAELRDGPAERARFSEPFGVAAAADGALYVSDAGDAHRIRRVTTDGVVSTLAGGPRGFADGAGPEARFSTPSGIALAPDGALYVADTGNNAIRRVSPDGRVTTIAGDGAPGEGDGVGRDARFNGPIGVAVDGDGRIVVADTYNDRIRAIAPDGTVTTLAGSSAGLLDGPASDAQFDTPSGIAVDAAGNLLVADTGNALIRVVERNGTVRTHGAPVFESLSRPIGVVVGRDGSILVSDERGRIVEAMEHDGRVLAGSLPGFRDGDAAEARFRRPAGLAWLATGRVLVADAENALLRLIASASQRDDVAAGADRLLPPLPASPLIHPRFDVRSFERWPLLWPVDPLEGPHEIAGTLGEARGGEGSERFHAGVDVRVEQGTPVLAIRPGIVSSPLASDGFGSLNESIRVGPLAYVHLRVGRRLRGEIIDASQFVPAYDERGKLARVRVKRGAVFATGDAIGTVNAFNHVHLNIGWSGEELNPLKFPLVRFDDTVSPTIPRGGVKLFDEQAQPLVTRVAGRLVVSGRVQVVVDAWDQVDANKPNRRLGLYSLGYQVLNADGSPAEGFETPLDTIRFDRLASGSDAPRLVYAPGSGIPFYGRRVTRFLYVVTNTLRDGQASAGFWDTSRLPPGDYTLRVRAADIRGNEAIANRDVPVTIAAPQ